MPPASFGATDAGSSSPRYWGGPHGHPASTGIGRHSCCRRKAGLSGTPQTGGLLGQPQIPAAAPHLPLRDAPRANALPAPGPCLCCPCLPSPACRLRHPRLPAGEASIPCSLPVPETGNVLPKTPSTSRAADHGSFLPDSVAGDLRNRRTAAIFAVPIVAPAVAPLRPPVAQDRLGLGGECEMPAWPEPESAPTSLGDPLVRLCPASGYGGAQ